MSSRNTPTSAISEPAASLVVCLVVEWTEVRRARRRSMCRAWEEEGGKGETMEEETQRKHGRTRPSSEYTAEMPLVRSMVNSL